MFADQLVAFYPCHDLAASRDFYERDLGLPLARDQGSCLIFKVTANGYVGFCQHEGELPKHDGLILTFVSDDVDDIYKRFKSRNIETEAPPKLNEAFQIYHFFARDPDGYRVEVQRFLERLE